MSNELCRLQAWYILQCNGEWEHTYGVTISTLDNPGWLLEVDLADTELASKSFGEINIQRENDDDWLRCSVQNEKFRGAGGGGNLKEIINNFLDWAGI